VPDPQDHATRDASVLRWAERTQGEHARLLDWYRSLIAERRRTKELTDGRLDGVVVDVADDASWLVVRRGSLRLACNLLAAPATVPLDIETGDVVLAWDPLTTRPGESCVALGAHGAALLRAD